jgi:hypothetical protein
MDSTTARHEAHIQFDGRYYTWLISDRQLGQTAFKCPGRYKTRREAHTDAATMLRILNKPETN